MFSAPTNYIIVHRKIILVRYRFVIRNPNVAELAVKLRLAHPILRHGQVYILYYASGGGNGSSKLLDNQLV
jgi:hypothetical protein